MRPLLYLILALSLIPALILGYNRISYEENYKTLTVAMDYQALEEQSSRTGTPIADLLSSDQQNGVNGIAIYEDIVQNRIKRGEVIYQTGADLLAQNPNAVGIKANWHYYREVTLGAVKDLPDRYVFPHAPLELNGLRWEGWSVPINGMPAGPNKTLMADLERQGFVLIYRPWEELGLTDPGFDFPTVGSLKVGYIAFGGDKVTGSSTPEKLEKVKSRLGEALVAYIESTEQDNLNFMLEGRAGIRLFAINPIWQAALAPSEVASKFVLAARERQHRILYLRPYETQTDTLLMLTDIASGLKAANLELGRPTAINYLPDDLLRWLCLLGPFCGLILLLSSYPLRWLATVMGLATLGIVILAGGFDVFGTLALLAGVTFPALGLTMRRNSPLDWLIASLWTLVGVIFLASLGTSLLGMLGLEPFKGVSLVLFWPILLFIGALIPNQDIRKTIDALYRYPIKMGDVAIIGIALGAGALIFLRRGNTTGAGASALEAKIREGLQDTLIRPRFKELIGHPIAILGLTKMFPPYFSNLMLMVGVFGQSSLMDTFAHYHTPFLISFYRAFNGVILGAAIGFILIPILLRIVKWFKNTPRDEKQAFEDSSRSWRGQG